MDSLHFQVWLCGGRVVNVPCSHAAHMEQPGSRDYRATWQQVINKNYRRVIEVWADDFKKYFFQYTPRVRVSDDCDLMMLSLSQDAYHCFTTETDYI